MTMESNTPLNLGTVYPLYYGTHYQTRESQLGSWVPEEPHSNTIYVGKQSEHQLQNLPKLVSCRTFLPVRTLKILQEALRKTPKKSHEWENVIYLWGWVYLLTCVWTRRTCKKKKNHIILLIRKFPISLVMEWCFKNLNEGR